jgi:hypothetical protein
MSIINIVGHGLAHSVIGDSFKPLKTAFSYGTSSLAPIEAPPLEMLMDLAIRGWIDETALKDGALLRGVTLDTSSGPGAIGGRPGSDLNVVWKQAYYARQTMPAEKEFLDIANRQCWSDGRVNDGLKRYGYYQEKNRQWVSNLRYDIPGPADLVRFSVRHVWEPDLLRDLGYDQEFPQIIDAWHRFKGLDYSLFTGDAPFREQIDLCQGEGTAAAFAQLYVDAGVSQPTWAKAYWWSHWVLPSPSQGYLMWARLNPLRDRKWDGPEMEGLDFGYPDLELLLRANDYPPKYRPLLAAISRPIPGIRYARQFAANGVYTYQDLYQWTQRQNYTHQDGLDITDSIWRDAQKAKSKAAACKECQAALAAYEVGILDRTDLVEQLIGYGLDAAQAEAEAAGADTTIGLKRAREVVAAVRRQFLLGGLDSLGAARILQHFGIVATRVEQYVTDWELESSFKFREIGAQKLIQWRCKGLISKDDLTVRLGNLRYDAVDVAGMVNEAEYCLAAALARAAAAAQRQEQQTIRQQIAAQKQALQAVKAMAQMLAGRATAKDLRKWFCEGLIGEGDVYRRLAFLQWPVDDITRLISDCKSGKKPTGGPKQPTGV